MFVNNFKNIKIKVTGTTSLVLGSFFFSLMTICVKKIDNNIPIYELVLFRSIFSLSVTSAIITKRKINPWGDNKKLLVIRGLLGTLALLCIFFSIRNMPLSIATVIQYTYPIFISIFASLLIKERFNIKILLALISGWFGILMILNPSSISNLNFELNKIVLCIAFLGSISTSLAYVAVKKLSKTEDIFVIIKYFPMISLIVLSPIVYFNWVMPKAEDFIWILGIGLFTQIGQTFLTVGLRKLPAAKASSINYLQVVFASLWGIYIFNEEITLSFIIGSLFVLLGTLISGSKFRKEVLK